MPGRGMKECLTEVVRNAWQRHEEMLGRGSQKCLAEAVRKSMFHNMVQKEGLRCKGLLLLKIHGNHHKCIMFVFLFFGNQLITLIECVKDEEC